MRYIQLFCFVLLLIFEASSQYIPYSVQYDLSLKNVKTYNTGINHKAKRIEHCEASKRNFEESVNYNSCVVRPNLNFKKEASYFVLENGRKVWLLKVVSRHAFELQVYFEKFFPSKSGCLFIYSKNQKIVDEKYETRKAARSGYLTTYPIDNTDEVYVEYSEEANETESSDFVLTHIVHRLFDRDEWVGSECSIMNNGIPRIKRCGHFDYNCFADKNAKATQSAMYSAGKAIVKIEYNGNDNKRYFGSGFIINTSYPSNAIYIATALHVLYPKGVSQNNINLNMVDIYFNYHNPKSICCNPSLLEEKARFTIGTGIEVLATVKEADFAIVKLVQLPDKYTSFTKLGWNRNKINEGVVSQNNFPQPYYCVHHPNADYKKIAISDNSIRSSVYKEFTNIANSDNSFPIKKAIGVPFTNRSESERCFIQGGSSGAPLMDNNFNMFGIAHAGKQNTNVFTECSDNWQDANTGYFSSFYDIWELSKGAVAKILSNGNNNVTNVSRVDAVIENSSQRRDRILEAEAPVVCSNLKASFYVSNQYLNTTNGLVQFFNTTSGGVYPIEYDWTFGDEGEILYAPERQDRDPTHDYQSRGCQKYSVTLRAEDAIGNVSYMYLPNYLNIGCSVKDWDPENSTVDCNKCKDETFDNRNFCGGASGEIIVRTKEWIKCRNEVRIKKGCHVYFTAKEWIEIDSYFDTAEEGCLFEAYTMDCNLYNTNWLIGKTCTETPSWWRKGTNESDTLYIYNDESDNYPQTDNNIDNSNKFYSDSKPLITPNPASDFTKIVLANQQFTWEIYSSLGKLVEKSIDLIYGFSDIDVSKFEDGVFFIKINTIVNGTYFIKFIKKHN